MQTFQTWFFLLDTVTIAPAMLFIIAYDNVSNGVMMTVTGPTYQIPSSKMFG